MSSLSYVGNWDFDKKTSRRTDYVEIHCSNWANNILSCTDGTIDLDTGYMNDGRVDIPLRAALFVNNGYVTEEIKYKRNKGYYLQVLMKNGKVYMSLVADSELYNTNFNQQFLLGNYKKRYFEEVYNVFPLARVFKLKNK